MSSFLISVVYIISVYSHEHHAHHECSNNHQNITKGVNLHQLDIPYKNHPYDKSNQDIESILNPLFTSQPTEPQKRSLLSSSNVSPIRISTYYDPTSVTNYLSSDEQAYLKAAIDAAINYYEQAVEVIPVDGSYFFDRTCDTEYNSSSGDTLCTSYASNTYCQYATVPDDHIGDALEYDISSGTVSTISGGVGIADTDLMIYVTGYSTTDCASRILAHAGPCA